MGRKDNSVEKDELPHIGARMRLARQSHSLSLSEISRRLDYTVPYLSAIENGKGRPSDALVEKYERELSLRPGELTSALHEVEEEITLPPSEKMPLPSSTQMNWGE